MAELCPLCYYQEIEGKDLFYKCQCQFKCCDDCFIDWIKQTFHSKILNEDLKLKCPNRICHVSFSFEQLRSKFVAYQKEHNSPEAQLLCSRFSHVTLNYYLQHKEDVRKCPQSNCQYSGYIDMRPCKELLVCGKCSYEWKDEAHLSLGDKIIKGITTLNGMSLKTLSKLHNLFLEQPCPNCGIMVQKNGGCPHMHCAKCDFDYCWHCMGDNNHEEENFCPIRYFVVKILWISLIGFLNLKLINNVDWIAKAEYYIFYYLGALIVVDFFIFTIYAVLMITKELVDNIFSAIRYDCSSYFCQIFLKSLLIVGLVAFQVWEIRLLVFLHPFALAQVFALIGELILAVFVGIGVCIFDCVRERRRRDQELNNVLMQEVAPAPRRRLQQVQRSPEAMNESDNEEQIQQAIHLSLIEYHKQVSLQQNLGPDFEQREMLRGDNDIPSYEQDLDRSRSRRSSEY